MFKIFTKSSKYRLLVVIMSYALCATIAHANDQQRAKGFYVSAEQSYNNGEYSSASSKLDRVEELLGSTNARIISLRIKIAYKKNQYSKAKKLFDRFYDLNPKIGLISEMADYEVKIDRKLKRQKQERAKEEKLAAQKKAKKLSQEARKLVEAAAKDANIFTSVMLTSTPNNYMIDNLGYVKIEVSSSDPCTIYVYTYDKYHQNGSYNQKWTIDLRGQLVIQTPPPLQSFYWTDISNLPDDIRRGINSELYDKFSEYPNAYYSNPSITKVNLVGLVTFSKRKIIFEESDYVKPVPSQSIQNHNYLENDDLFFGIVFSRLEDSWSFYRNITSAYKSYCPSN